MAHQDNIRLVKGTYDITLFTTDASESGENKMTVIPIPTTSSGQTSGQKVTKVVDLLRITNTFHIMAYITNLGGVTANVIKQNLITLFKGAGVDGGHIDLYYDNDTYHVFAQKWVIQKVRTPTTITTATTDVPYYIVTLDFVEGEKA